MDRSATPCFHIPISGSTIVHAHRGRKFYTQASFGIAITAGRINCRP